MTSETQIQSELEHIAELFSSPELLPKALSYSSIAFPKKHSRAYSMRNKAILLVEHAVRVHGGVKGLANCECTIDAAGYKQWPSEFGRNVMKGARSVQILAPVIISKCDECEKQFWGMPADREYYGKRHIENDHKGIDAKLEEIFLRGRYNGINVFLLEETEGKEYPVFKPSELPPLTNVAEKFGIKVKYGELGTGVYGLTVGTFPDLKQCKSASITLASTDVEVWFHELIHAVHDKITDMDKLGSASEQEAIAVLGAAVLMKLYGREPNIGFGYKYIQGYISSNSRESVGQMAYNLMGKVEKILKEVMKAASAVEIPVQGQTVAPTPIVSI